MKLKSNISKITAQVLGLCLASISGSVWGYDFTPDRNSVPVSRSIELKGAVGDYVQFVYNRGRGSVSFKELFLNMLSPEYIRGLKGFRSYKTTRLDISVYEFRLIESIKPIEDLLKKGIQFRFVADSSTFLTFKALSDEQFKALSDSEQQSYLQSYDEDRDGVVSESDEASINEKRFLAIEAHKKLEQLQKKFPAQVELVQSPAEIVSTSKLLPFIRLHHLKDASIAFLRDRVWHYQVSLRSSANATDSCMDKRVAISHGNKLRYINGDFAHTNYAKGSQGNVQFGAVIKGESILDSIQSIKDVWIALYKRGKHFDEGPLSTSILPRIVIDDPRGYRSTLETYHSEGTKAEGRKTVDPVLVALHHLSGPDKSLRVHYSTQFVSTHPAKNHALRYLIDKAGDKMEDFFVLVDGNFAVAPYSALPQLAFAPALSLQFGTLEGRSIRDLPPLPAKLDWEDSIGVYEGTQGVYGADGDKLHAKVDYYEYVTSSGERHYVVVWGSANSSKNAARGNADSLHVLDTTDPSVGKVVKQYFAALRTDPRVFPYSMAFLDRKLRETFNWDQRILNEDALKETADYLSGKSGDDFTLKRLIDSLSKAKTNSAYGINFLSLLRWYNSYAGQRLNWQDLHVLLELSHPEKLVPGALTADLAKRWNLDTKIKFNTLERAIKSLKKEETFGAISVNVARILKNCEGYLNRLGVKDKASAMFSSAEHMDGGS